MEGLLIVLIGLLLGATTCLVRYYLAVKSLSKQMRRIKDYKEYQKDSGPVEIRHPLIVARYFPQNRTPSEEYDLHD